jgi:DNA-directed RNA polymerase beta subunit
MNSLQNFQSKEWTEFFKTGIYTIFSNYSFNYKGIEVRLETDAHQFIPSVMANYTQKATLPLKYTLHIKSNQSYNDGVSEITKQDILAMNIPLLTTNGITLDGTHYSPISRMMVASGWYLQNSFLTLRKGMGRRIVVGVDSKSGQICLFPSSIHSGNKKPKPIPILIFLKAIGPKYTYSDILGHLRNLPVFNSSYAEVSQHMQAEECARMVLPLFGDSNDYPDYIATLHNRLFVSNYLNVGKCRRVRFKNFLSFDKAEGLELAQDVDVGVVYREGEIITKLMASQMDDYGINKIYVKFNGSVVELFKIQSQPQVTYEEIVTAIYYYGLGCLGLAKEDDQDDYCNKILVPISGILSDTIEKYLYELTEKLRRNIDLSSAGISDLVSNNIFESLDATEELVKQIKESSDFQQMDETNSLASFEQGYHIDGAGGSNINSMPTRARDVQQPQFGRVCPYTTSESKKVGINLSLSTYARVDEYGFITTPYYKVTHGKRTEERTYVSANDERGHVVAPFSVDLSKDLTLEEQQSICEGCRMDGTPFDATYDEISYQEVSSSQITGLLVSYIPAANHDNGKRLILGGNALKQTFPSLRHSPPMVSTGIEASIPIGIIYGRDIIRKELDTRGFFDAEIPEDTKLIITDVSTLNNTTIVGFTSTHQLLQGDEQGNFNNRILESIPCVGSTVDRSMTHGRVKLKDSKEYSMSEIVIYNSDVTLDDYKVSSTHFGLASQNIPNKMQHLLSLGENVKIMFKSYDGFGYEDSFIVSDAFAAMMGLATINVFTIKEEIEDNQMCCLAAELSVTEREYIMKNGLPSEGTHLHTNSVVIARISTHPLREDEPEPEHFVVGLEPGMGYSDSSRRIQQGEDGVVISSSITSAIKNGKSVKIARVTLANVVPLRIGDKITGMHGNKGVVSRICPYSELPFTEDGTVPDIIINPLGPVARENIGQCVEALLGAVAESTNEVQLLPAFDTHDFEEIMNQAKVTGVTETVIYDGRTGEPYPKKAFIGVMHFLRNKHVATSEFGVCGNITRRKRSNGQPPRGAHGGQSISELSANCFHSYNAEGVYDTLFTVQSDDVADSAILQNSIESGDLPKSNIPYKSMNIGMLEAYFRTIGVNIHSGLSETYVEPINSEACLKIADGTVPVAIGTVNPLRNSAIFGTESYSVKGYKGSRVRYGRIPLGCDIIMPIFLLSSTFLSTVVYRHYKLNIKQIGKSYEQALYRETSNMFDDTKVKTELSTMSVSAMSSLLDGKMVFTGFGDDGIPNLYNIDLLLQDSSLSRLDSWTNKGIFGAMKIFMEYNPNITLSIIENTINDVPQAGGLSTLKFGSSGKSGIEKHRANLIAFLNAYTDSSSPSHHGKWYHAFITNSVLVPPIGYRPQYKGNASTALDRCLTSLYNQVVYTSMRADGSETKYRYYNIMYSRIRSFTEEPTDIKKSNTGKQSIWAAISDHQSDSSVLRDQLASKRIDHSARAVISVNSKLRLDTVGVPLIIGMEIFGDHLAARVDKMPSFSNLVLVPSNDKSNYFKQCKAIFGMLATGNITDFAEYVLPEKDLFEVFRECKQEITDTLAKLFIDYPAVLNREPSSHRFNMSGMYGVPVDSYSIQLHPLCCKRYNADFDGDHMAIYFPQLKVGINDVKQKMMVSDNLVNPKDSELVVDVNQDMLLGCYYGTVFDKGVSLPTDSVKMHYCIEPIQAGVSEYFDDSAEAYPKSTNQYMKNIYFSEIWRDIECGEINIHDIIVVDIDGCYYKTTAGRILINSLIGNREAFRGNDSKYFKGYSAPMFDVVINKSTISNFLNFGRGYYKNILNNLADSMGKFLDRVMDFGFWLADKSNVSLSLFDFENIDITTRFSPEINKAKQDCETASEYYKKGFINKQELDALTTGIWKKVTASMQSSILSMLPKDNNLYTIVDSGARGGTQQLVNMLGSIGIVRNARGADIPIPVMGNYLSGLNSGEAAINSYNIRSAVISAQLTTEDVGEENRKLNLLCEHQSTSSGDRPCNCESTHIHLDYKLTIKGNPNSVYISPDIPDSIQATEGERTQWNNFIQHLTQFSKQLVLDELARKFIIYHKLDKVYLVEDNEGEKSVKVYGTQFSLTDMSRSLIWYRSFDTSKLNELSEEFCNTCLGYAYPVVLDETIDLIESYRLEDFYIYTMIGCEGHDGICKRCFGLGYDTDRFPDYNEHIGYQCTQAIGEPTLQLFLDAHKSNKPNIGLGAVNVLLNHPESVTTTSIVAKQDGTLKIVKGDSDYEVYLVDNSNNAELLDCVSNLNSMLYVDGSKITKGTAITEGTISYKNLRDLVGAIPARLQLWKDIINAYNCNVLARNFEIVAKCLSEYGIPEVDCPEHQVYKGFPCREAVLRKYDIKYTPTIVSYTYIMKNSDKVFASILKGNGKEGLGTFVTRRTRDCESSYASKALLGDLMSKRIGNSSFGKESFGLLERMTPKTESVHLITNLFNSENHRPINSIMPVYKVVVDNTPDYKITPIRAISSMPDKKPVSEPEIVKETSIFES